MTCKKSIKKRCKQEASPLIHSTLLYDDAIYASYIQANKEKNVIRTRKIHI